MSRKENKCKRLKALQGVNGRNTSSKSAELWDKYWGSVAWFPIFLGKPGSLGARSWQVPSFKTLTPG